MNLLKSIGNCFCHSFDACIKLCHETGEEKGKVSIYIKSSPMLDSRRSSTKSFYSTTDSTSLKDESHLSACDSKSALLDGKGSSSRKSSYGNNLQFDSSNVKRTDSSSKSKKKYETLKILVELIYDKELKTLSINVLPRNDLPDHFDMCLNGPQTLKPLSALFNETKTLKEITESTLKDSYIVFKFYERKTTNDVIPFGEGFYSLKSFLSAKIRDKKKHIKTEVNIIRNNLESSVGSIEISLRYDLNDQQLMVNILRGKSLFANVKRSLNPFCSVELIKNQSKTTSFKTSVKQNTENPEWNQAFFLPATPKDFNKHLLLKIVVYSDSDMGKQSIGKLIFPSIPLSLEHHHWNMVQSRPNQTITKWQMLKKHA